MTRYKECSPDEYQIRQKERKRIEEHYKDRFKEQNGRCAICGCDEVDNTISMKRLSKDHCHSTNKLRGLLCSQCNLGLGAFKDQIPLLEMAIRYLKRYSGL